MNNADLYNSSTRNTNVLTRPGELDYVPEVDGIDQLKKELVALAREISAHQESMKDVPDQIQWLTKLAHDLDEINCKMKMVIRDLKIKHVYLDH